MTTRLPVAARGPIAYVANLTRAAFGRHPHVATLRHSQELETLHTLGQKQNAQSTPWLALGGAFTVGLLGLNLGQWATHQRQATVIQRAEGLLNPATAQQSASAQTATSNTPPPPAPPSTTRPRSYNTRTAADRLNNSALMRSLRTGSAAPTPFTPRPTPEARP